MKRIMALHHQYTLLISNIFGFKGGIQIYSAFLLQGLQCIDSQADYQVLLKYDRSYPQNHSFLPQTQFHCFGGFSRWLQSSFMALKMVQLALQNLFQNSSHLFICTHINYSLVCYYLKYLFGIRYWVDFQELCKILTKITSYFFTASVLNLPGEKGIWVKENH